MLDLRLGMKIYDNNWFLRHQLQPAAAADVLAAMGVTFVIAQSRFLPMASSAVENTIRPQDAPRFAELDDVAFRDALRERRIGYVACLNIGFDPGFAAAHPHLLPIDQFGQRETMQDWYIGLPPDRAENIEHKIRLLENGVRALDPDAVHLGFIRWPGFWETWLPDVDRSKMPDYCYGVETLSRFRRDTRAHLPVDDPVAAAKVIAERYRIAWRDWKCGVTVDAIGAIRTRLAAIKPSLPIAINTLPLFRADFDNAVEEVFGQDIGRLSDVVDIFEVMAYHQVMGRDEHWPAAIGADIKHRTTRKAICTLQANALYLSGMHAGKGRAVTLDASEFARAVDAVEASPVDGLCVFTFTDFLDMRHAVDGRRKIDRIGGFRR